jgi:hypothetical protein
LIDTIIAAQLRAQIVDNLKSRFSPFDVAKIWSFSPVESKAGVTDGRQELTNEARLRQLVTISPIGVTFA